MPLLSLDPSLYPDDVLERDGMERDGSRWWVLHTRPRAEKAVARECLRGGLSFFLPLQARKWRKRGRWLHSQLPLFPGYVFLFGRDGDRIAALRTNLLVNVLAVADQRQLRQDLRQVQRLLQSGTPLLPEARLTPGTAVEIVAGPLAGLRGRILRIGSRWTFSVAVQFLQRSVSCQVESWMLDALGKPFLPRGPNGKGKDSLAPTDPPRMC